MGQLCRDVCSHRITLSAPPLDGRRWGVQGRAARPERGSRLAPCIMWTVVLCPPIKQRFPWATRSCAAMASRRPRHRRCVSLAARACAAAAGGADRAGDMKWRRSSMRRTTATATTTPRSASSTGGPSPDLMMPGQQPRLAVMAEPISIPPERPAWQRRVRDDDAHGSIPPTSRASITSAPSWPWWRRKIGAVEAIYRTPDDLVTEGTRRTSYLPHGQAAHA